MNVLDMMNQIPNAMPMPDAGYSSSDSETPRKKRGTNSTVKRRPYTRLACFTCKEKHQKCDGGRPCSNCTNKGVECRYRQERNRRRDGDGDIREEIQQLHTKVEQWKNKYLALKKFVGTKILCFQQFELTVLDETLLCPTTFPVSASVASPFPTPTNKIEMPALNAGLFNPFLVPDSSNGVLNPFLDYGQIVGLGLLPQNLGDQMLWNNTPTTATVTNPTENN